MENKHLDKIISEIKSYPDDELISYEHFQLLLGELVLIKVYCACEDYEFILDDKNYVQVFTTHEKFSEFYDDSQLEIYDFEDAILYLNGEEGEEGVVINPESDDLPLSLQDLIDFRFNYNEPRPYDRKSNHIPKQLNKLKKIKNKKLEDYLNEDYIDIEELLKKVSQSKVFALIKAKRNIKAKKGVINRTDDEYYIDEEGFGYIFSSWDKIEKVDDNVYVTVPIPEVYVRYILNNDFEGIILNEDFILSRKFLILNINAIMYYSRENYMDDYSNYGLKLDND